jgi:IS5 family transposase
MLSTQKKSNQISLFTSIESLIDQKHPLFLLANEINWCVFEEQFKKHYSEKWVSRQSQSGLWCPYLF